MKTLHIFLIVLPLLAFMEGCTVTLEPDEIKPDVWYNINPDANAIFSDLHFLDENRGWIVGQTKCTENDDCTGNRAVSYRTIDGGRNWNNKVLALHETRFEAVHFFDDFTGVASFSKYHKTIDGGNNWTQLGYLFGSCREIGFANDQIGWMCGQHAYNAGVYKTIDQGNSWFVLDKSIDSTDGTYFDISVLSTSSLYVLGNHILIYSDDGGESWKNIILPDPIMRFWCVKFLTPEFGWIAGQWRMFHTKDGGNSWDRVDIEELPTNIYSIDAIDSLHVVIGCMDGSILVTNDGWATYSKPVIGNRPDKYSIGKLQYTKSGTVYAVGNGTVIKAKLSM